MKTYLFVMRKPAHSGLFLQESLDLIFTTAAFDQSVSLLLLDDAVFHLKKQQNPETACMKDTAALFKALAMYDVNDIHAETESLAERGITTEDMILPVQALPRAEVNAFMSQFDIVWAN